MKEIDRDKPPIVVDEDNYRQIVVGTKVHFYDDKHQVGVVVEITEAEADVDEGGMPLTISPRVYIHWDRKPMRERILYGKDWYNTGFGTTYDVKSHTYICEELVVI